LTAAYLTNASFHEANLDRVNLTAATLIDVDVFGASMIGLDITNATIFNTGIGIGGGDD